jgi:hypothetical protein
MPKGKDQKIEQTENQCDPYLARPEDFPVSTPDQIVQKVPGHGQRGRTLREQNRLLNNSKRPHHSDHGQTLPSQARD